MSKKVENISNVSTLPDALVELPLSSLGDEKEMACKLAKGKKCKKVNSKPEPKKKTQLYKGKKGGKKGRSLPSSSAPLAEEES